MVELTEREKKIIFIKFIIHGNSPYADTPLSVRIQMLQAALKITGIKYDESELFDLGEAILSVQQSIENSLLGFIQTNKDLVNKALSMIDKGGDRLKF